jgi:hypothetical protein
MSLHTHTLEFMLITTQISSIVYKNEGHQKYSK